MTENQYISINGEFRPVVLTPQLLEMNGTLTRSRRGGSRSVNTFSTNPLKVVQVLCKAYDISWKGTSGQYRDIAPPHEEQRYYRIRINAMDIDVVGVGSSMRKAKRNAIFKLHRAYCSKCKSHVIY